MIKIEDYDIGYIRELDKQFGQELKLITTLDELKELFTKFELIAWEGKDIVDTWSEETFTEFITAKKKENRGRYMGDEAAEKFLEVLMPEPMFRITMKAIELHVCWGLVYRRLIDNNLAEIVSERLVIKEVSK